VAVADPVDDDGVDVQPADVVEAVDGHDLVAGGAAAYHAGVERPGTQVVDDQGLADRDVPVEDPGEVVGRGDRFGYEPPVAQSGRLEPAVVQGVAAHDERPFGRGEHGRREQRGALEQQRLDAGIRPAQHRDGVRGTEVDPQPEGTRLHTVSI